MLRSCILAIVALTGWHAIGAPALVAGVTLDALAARAPTQDSTPARDAEFTAELYRLIESNSLKTGAEFARAAEFARYGIGGEFRKERVRYELLLAAVARDHAAAEKELAGSWDAMLTAVGRPVRMDFEDILNKRPDVAYYVSIEPAPACVQAVWRDPVAARTAARAAKDNAELQAIVDADQAVRQKDWSKFTPEEHKALREGDRTRNARTREIVKAGALRTPADFANASLVMQHSPAFPGYQLAHELAVCSLLLGDRQMGRWLVAATYDRMLGSIGHDQRFGTQYMGDAPIEIDERGICDEQRVALGCRGVAKASADSLVRQAESLVEQKRFAEAESVARESIARRTVAYSAGAWQIFSAQRILGASLVGQKKFTEAEPVLLEAYRGLKAQESAIPDLYRTRIAETAELLQQTYHALDRSDKAAEWKHRIEEIERARVK
jgi:hypothetical protein